MATVYRLLRDEGYWKTGALLELQEEEHHDFLMTDKRNLWWMSKELLEEVEEVSCSLCGVSFKPHRVGSLCDSCRTAHPRCTTCDSTEGYVKGDRFYCKSCDNRINYREILLTLKGCRKQGNIITDSRLVGVELESVAANRNTDKALLYSLIDDSIGVGSDAGGIELRTPPRAKLELETMIENTCVALKNSGHGVNEFCGTHVHFDFTKEREKENWFSEILPRFQMFMVAVEDIAAASIPNSRKRKGSSPVARYRFGLGSCKSTAARGSYISGRNGFNFGVISDQGTFECRFHEGTINASEILHWSGFLLKLIRFALHAKDSHIEKMLSHGMATLEKRTYLYKLTKMDDHLIDYLEKRIAENSGTTDEEIRRSLEENSCGWRG